MNVKSCTTSSSSPTCRGQISVGGLQKYLSSQERQTGKQMYCQNKIIVQYLLMNYCAVIKCSD